MNLHDVLFSLMHKIRGEISGELQMLGGDLSPMHMKSLKVISVLEDCTGQKMAQFMNRDKAQINRLVKDLVTQELIEKQVNPEDKRSQLLVLSEKGNEVLKEFNRVETQVFDRMTKGVNEADLKRFVEVANCFNQNI